MTRFWSTWPFAIDLQAPCSYNAGPLQLECKPNVVRMQAPCNQNASAQLGCMPSAARVKVCSYNANSVQLACRPSAATCNWNADPVECIPSVARMRAQCSYDANPK